MRAVEALAVAVSLAVAVGCGGRQAAGGGGKQAADGGGKQAAGGGGKQAADGGGKQAADGGATDAAGGPAGPPVPLVVLTDFVEVRADDDPFAHLAPERRACDPPAFVIERDLADQETLEVRTDVCNYVTLVQPSRQAIARGDTLSLLMWHNTLDTNESALAHVVLQLGDHVAWSVDVPVPAQAESYSPSWRAGESLPEGTPVYLHIRNHGANSWRFAELTLSVR